MAGLTAAAALASRLHQVTLIDRDTLPAQASPRQGVPQSAHAHLLLRAGLDALERLLPGLTDELGAAEGLPINAGRDMPFFQFGAHRQPYDSPVDLISATRPMLEGMVRARLCALPNVTIRATRRRPGSPPTRRAGSAG